MSTPSSQSRANLIDNYGVYTYQDLLVQLRIEDHNNWQHREYSLKWDHNVKLYISKLDSDILSENPITTPNIFGEPTKIGKPTENIDEGLDDATADPDAIDIEEFDVEENSGTNISKEWEKEKWNCFFATIMDIGRLHSWCVAQPYDRPPYWKVYYQRHIVEIYYDDEKNPIGCHLKYTEQCPLSEKYINYDEDISFIDEYNEEGYIKPRALFIRFGTPIGDDLGQYDLQAIWTLIINCRYSNFNVSNNSAKTAGFLWAMYADGIQEDEQTKLDNALDLASSSRGVGAPEGVLKLLTALAPKNPEFTILALDKFMKQLAGACRLPMSFFNSESEAGNPFGEAIKGPETTTIKKMDRLFGMFKPYFIKLIELRWGIKLDDIQANIDRGTDESEYEDVIDKSQTNKQDFGNNKEKPIEVLNK